MFEVRDRITNTVYQVYSVERGNMGTSWFLIYLYHTWVWVNCEDYEPIVKGGDNNA